MASDIVLGTDDVQITGATAVHGTLDVSDAFSVAGDQTLGGALKVKGSADMQGASFGSIAVREVVVCKDLVIGTVLDFGNTNIHLRQVITAMQAQIDNLQKTVNDLQAASKPANPGGGAMPFVPLKPIIPAVPVNPGLFKKP